jgi:predicted trehalose synthase
MTERRDTYCCLNELAERRLRLTERLQQSESRVEGWPAEEAERLRGELLALEREMRQIVAAN